MESLDLLIAKAKEHIEESEPEDPEWWMKVPLTEEECAAQAAKEEDRGFTYIPGPRPVEKGGNYGEET